MTALPIHPALLNQNLAALANNTSTNTTIAAPAGALVAPPAAGPVQPAAHTYDSSTKIKLRKIECECALAQFVRGHGFARNDVLEFSHDFDSGSVSARVLVGDRTRGTEGYEFYIDETRPDHNGVMLRNWYHLGSYTSPKRLAEGIGGHYNARGTLAHPWEDFRLHRNGLDHGTLTEVRRNTARAHGWVAPNSN